jgi:hypothetical protein
MKTKNSLAEFVVARDHAHLLVSNVALFLGRSVSRNRRSEAKGARFNLGIEG